ncbi:MAG: hypothetical protein JRJ84_21120 [Deltaproteobacteria bacterium]|nr:hypothetical protein [Deltaproteobacteria bacterium]
MFTALLFTIVLAPVQAQASTWAPGATIQEAASIQATQAGLDALADVVPFVVPENFDIPAVIEGEGSCYGFEFSNAWVGIGVDDVRLIPRTNVLDIEADLQVWLNDSSDPFYLWYDTCLWEEGCWTRVDPFPVYVTMPATMDVVTDLDGNNVIDVTLGTVTYTHGLTTYHLDPDFNCSITSIDTVLDWVFGFSLIEFLVEIIEPVLDAVIADQMGDIEAMLEDALSAARFEDVIAIGATNLEVMVEPQNIDITPNGLEIYAQGRMFAEQGECMVDRDPGGSLKTSTPVPDITANPPGTQVAVQLSDDIGNQALYAIWRSGLFCYDLSEGGDFELPIPLNTSLLGIIGGEGFTALFPESMPMRIVTSPDESPLVNYEGEHDIVAEIRELGVDFFAEVDFRQTRALGIDLEVDAGVDLAFDGTLGELALDVTLAPEDTVIIASHNELVAGSDETISDNFGGVLEVLLEVFLGDLLDQISFLIPSLNGVGLSSIASDPSGGGDWLGVRATVGPVPYDNSDAENGCGGEGGCATAGPNAVWWFLPGLLWLRRRERRR